MEIMLTIRKAEGHDVPLADASDETEVKEEERGGDQPVRIAGHEKLPAVRSDNPPAARRHREVGDGRHATHEGGREEHTARGLVLRGVDSKEECNARHHDEDEL